MDKPRPLWMPRDRLEWLFAVAAVMGFALVTAVLVWMALSG